MPPSRTQNGPDENLSGVMGRFQAWNVEQAARQPGATSFEGVREVTYDEALAAQRLRRPVRLGIPQHLTQEVALDATHDLATLLTPKKPVVSAIASANAVPLKGRTPEPVKASSPASTATAAKKTTRSASSPVLAVQAKAVKTGRGKATGLHAASARPETPRGTASARARIIAAAAVEQASSRVEKGRLAPPSFKQEMLKQLKMTAADLQSAVESKPQIRIARSKAVQGKNAATKVLATKSPMRKPSGAKSVPAAAARATSGADFRLAHAEPVNTATASLRSISMNLRLSHAEHAALRVLAASAKLPMAAYVRVCALRPDYLENHQPLSDRPTRQGLTIAEPAEVTPRSFSETAIDFVSRMRVFLMGRRLEVTA